MMVKFGKIMSCEYHLCYAHAIQIWTCVMSFIRKDSGESTVELENIAHEEEEEDIDESEGLIEYLGKALDLEFEVGIATDAM
uniref:Uncharacterized protein n=1 Tax=Araneus ventricosus TaxID=182803 RepID=A0A4Y2QVX2_ARAVE|nr:hypothetical protein AVEN_226372-1 [Araneus ventricosus]